MFLRTAADAKSRSSQPRPTVTVGQSVSTATALIEAARQAGTLDQLADEARAAADLKAAQKVENAEAFISWSSWRAARGPRSPLGSRPGWPS